MKNRRVGRRALAISVAAVALASTAPVAASAVTPPSQPLQQQQQQQQEQQERVIFRCELVRPDLPTKVVGERCESRERGPLFEPFIIVEHRRYFRGRAFECRHGYSDSPVFVEGRYCRRIRWIEQPQQHA
jgi:hypothetical protein